MSGVRKPGTIRADTDQARSDQGRATLSEVASAAGVSISVASRVLTNDARARIHPTTRTRVQEAAERLRYVPDHRSRALRLARSSALGLIVPDVNNAVFADLVAGVQEVAAPKDIAVLLGQVDRADARHGLADLVGQRRVDGVIVQRREVDDDAALRAMIDLDVPVVLFNSRLPRRPGSVILDDAEGVHRAVDHLVELGHQRIAWIGGNAIHDAAKRRLTGFRTAMRGHRLRVARDWVITAGWESDAGRAGLRKLLAAQQRPTAVVVASVNAGLGTHAEATAAGVSIPDELSLITLHDSWMTEIVHPALTVVKLPLRQAGSQAAAQLIAALSGTAAVDEVTTVPEPELIIRDSTASPAP